MQLRTIYVCPVEGIVPKEEGYTHQYNFSFDGKILFIHTINKMNEPIVFKTVLSRRQIIDLFMRAEADGDGVIGAETEDQANALLNDFPDNLVETIMYLIDQYCPEKSILIQHPNWVERPQNKMKSTL